jgi:uncharacterized protein YukE
MSRYSVELDELLAFVDRLDQFNKRSEAIARAVDQEITELHGTWSGLGADAETQYHATWMKLAEEMRSGADYLRKTALNSSMWP